jgi:hypothetical protein
MARARRRRSSRRLSGDRALVDAIRAGCRVTIVDRFGVQRTGRAVMRGPAGWVLNMGGRHGTPAIASDPSIVQTSPFTTNHEDRISITRHV